MKQHIMIEQIKELNKSAYAKLCDYIIQKIRDNDGEDPNLFEFDGDANVPLLTIGQMMEFIMEETGACDVMFIHSWDNVLNIKGWSVIVNNLAANEELVDALWEVVKTILEQ